MRNTGYILCTYKDTNPYSSTYEQTKVERFLDEENCPVTEPRDYKVNISIDEYGETNVSCDSTTSIYIEDVLKLMDSEFPGANPTEDNSHLKFGDCLNTLLSNNKYDVMFRNYFVVSVDIGEGIVTLDRSSLCALFNLTQIIWGKTKKLRTIGEKAFKYCRRLALTTIPEGVTTIGKQAFYQSYYYNQTELTDLTLPSTITTINEEAFYMCHNLNSITLLTTTPPTLGTGAFDWTYASSEGQPYIIYVPDESLSLYANATNWRTYYDANRIKGISEK